MCSEVRNKTCTCVLWMCTLVYCMHGPKKLIISHGSMGVPAGLPYCTAGWLTFGVAENQQMSQKKACKTTSFFLLAVQARAYNQAGEGSDLVQEGSRNVTQSLANS